MKLEGAMKPFEGKLAKATTIATKFRADAAKKNTEELEKIRTAALEMIFHHQGAKKLLNDGLYEAFDKKKTGKVKEAEFAKFFKTCEKKEGADELSADELSRLFEYLDCDSEGFLSQDFMMNFTRKF